MSINPQMLAVRDAAATAAAYARELLMILPVAKDLTPITYVPSPYQHMTPDRWQLMLDALTFEQMDSRRVTIETAHAETYRRLLNHSDYQEWLDRGKLTQQDGFLWISGQPGAGKSTIMKFAYSKMKSKAHSRQAVIASFSFIARGESSERSILGMYRSSLFQLLQGYSDLQIMLDDPDIVPRGQNGCPSLTVLKALFRHGVSALSQRPFTYFVDALDECDQQQIVDMVRYFEDLAEKSVVNGVPFRICFSGRRYPYINIRRGIRLTLEAQQGHAEDLEKYVTRYLQLENATLVGELLEKAAGVFLWVVLVVNIPNREINHGELALRK
ncbi:hypothetical protein QQS21_010803 [Conoideocrella luteorostrata]|uniref:Nephrocystin 3-like N-terminal domain-containing protein n=1 Tax=Conoideocrella luteorostrata TaxID=1105319 RepID=A0AAJ0CEL4_9HYPO|nr:hypothetical protein QQS21_010803 [Conoideocrella luteorostrata]